MSSAAIRRKKIETLARQNYGSTSTCGPRQVAVVASIFLATSGGVRASVDALALQGHRVYGRNNVIFTLRARKLIKGHPSNLQLTPAGLEIARLVNRSTVAPGLGLVAIGVPSKRP